MSNWDLSLFRPVEQILLIFASRKTITQREVHLSENKMVVRPPLASPTCNTPPPTLSGWWCRNLSGRPSILANQSITFISSSVQAGLEA